jgi:hypothetical protein
MTTPAVHAGGAKTSFLASGLRNYKRRDPTFSGDNVRLPGVFLVVFDVSQYQDFNLCIIIRSVRTDSGGVA